MMIELKNIYKAYKSKKGNNTVALKDVSLKFEETGMTFILGKSGSGKSTLLNIIGGLDKYDSGDMIILGKSSKDFKQADFDSYRNTYIGFIFQEFNILEDYDVYQNIVLALQLQQKSTHNKIDELLNKLELNSLKHRKVNELSGGQKQRVAIARALIKNPKIILADEPTGNLDSSTSKQVMDLLKEISKEKLVIIVSHDKESASIYGDRVIEIVDGKVESDIVKHSKQKETTDSYKIIKSKLPWKESFKLGLGSLKTKKIKLFFTIFLTIFTLLFLSLSDTLAGFDNETSHAKLLTSRQEQFVQIEKYKLYNNAEYVDKDKLALKEIDSKNILSKLNRDTYPIYQIQEDYNHMMVVDLFNISTDKDNTLYTPLSGSATADIVVTDDINKIIKEPVIGKKPTANNEIVISNYIADLIIDKGITVYENIVNNEFGVSNLFKPKNYEELINSNHTFYFGSVGKAKIVGLVNYDLSKYQCLKGKKYDADNISEEEVKLSRELTREIQNIYNKIYVNNDFISNLKVKDISFLYPNNTYNLISDEINLQQNGYHISPTILSKEIEYYNGTNWVKTNHLAKNEAILDVSQLVDFDSRNYIEELEKYLNKHEGENRELLEKKFFTNYVKDYKVFSKNIALKIYEGRSYNQKNPDRVFDNIKIIGLVDSNSNDKGNKSNYFSTELVN
ncbi:MAG: ABC transporter ATP-binding protein, partial [Bacilli bacterium]